MTRGPLTLLVENPFFIAIGCQGVFGRRPLLRDEAAWNRLARTAHARVAQDWTPAAVAPRVLEVLGSAEKKGS